MKIIAILQIPFFLAICLPAGGKTSVSEFISTLTAIQSKGVGNSKAVKDWEAVSTLPSSAIPKLLAAMNKANDLGDNWIRSAVSEILDREKDSFPEKEILAFLKDKQNTGSSRMFAFEIIQDKKTAFAQSLTPGFIDDPEPSLRRLAIENILLSARGSNKPKRAKALYEKVLSKGREVDQIKEASEALEEAGETIDIQSLMGFLPDWQTVGPFDNTGRKGFNTPFPPEEKIDLDANYQGKEEKIKWSPFSTTDPFGMLDVNLQYGEVKEVLAYAHTTFRSDSVRPAQFRIGSKNAWKLWVNGKLLFARDEYHRGKTRVDQFIVNGQLREGENEILVKVCQNEQTQSWTKQWEFCLRITDPTGTALHPDPGLSSLSPAKSFPIHEYPTEKQK